MQEARRAAETEAFQQLEEAERSFAVERAALLDEADTAATEAAARQKVIDELRQIEVVLKGELQNIRQEPENSGKGLHAWCLADGEKFTKVVPFVTRQ